MKQNVIVTGGASGIGKSIVENLKHTYQIIVIDKLLGTDNDVDHFTCDLNNIDALYTVIKEILDKYKQVYALINNAAMQIVEPFEEVSVDHWNQTLNVNLRAPFFLSQWICNAMQEDSIIVNITSIHSEKPRLNKMPYDISKAGLNLLTKELALALSFKGIRVNGVSCGATKTPLNNNFIDKQSLNDAVIKIPLGRVALPGEVASLVCWLLGDDARYITGSIFTIDGGRSLL